MQFCPQCGSAVNPDKKFCSQCGASLTPDLPAPGTETPTAATPGFRPPIGIIAVAGLLIILAIIFVVNPVLTGSSIFGASTSPAAPETVNGNGSTQGGSWVEVITEEPTPLPTTELPVSTSTTTLTTVPTTVMTTKPVICAADRIKCNNTCVDLRTDSSNCGYCGTTCDSDQFCLNGQCMKACSASQTSCPDGCFDLQSDRDHCGTCLNDCPKGLICYRGQCMAPATPMPVPL